VKSGVLWRNRDDWITCAKLGDPSPLIGLRVILAKQMATKQFVTGLPSLLLSSKLGHPKGGVPNAKSASQRLAFFIQSLAPLCKHKSIGLNKKSSLREDFLLFVGMTGPISNFFVVDVEDLLSCSGDHE
jgi:hypothetical protein